MPLDTLEALFVHELHDLYGAEKQLVNVLPKMAQAALSHRLRRGFEGHLHQARGHMRRLEHIVERHESKPPRGAEQNLPEGTVFVLMPLYGEWVPVASCKPPARPHGAPAYGEPIAAESDSVCAAMEVLTRQGQHLIDEDAEPHVKDAGLIAKAQQMEHFEIAGYRTARAHAQLLGDHDAERLLEQTLDEVQQTDQGLTALAESEVNVAALVG